MKDPISSQKGVIRNTWMLLKVYTNVVNSRYMVDTYN